MARLRREVDFTAEDCRALKEAGLTDKQLLWLRRSLPEVADFVVTPASFGDVADRIAAIKRHYTRAQGQLEAAASKLKSLSEPEDEQLIPTPHLPRQVAAGHIAIAAADLHLGREVLGNLVGEDAKQVVPGRVDPLVLTRILVVACEHASRTFPAGERSLRRSKAPAIKIIERALNRPGDADSIAAARSMPVSRASNAPFLRVAEIVFRAVSRAKGNDNDTPSPEHAIRVLLEQRRKPRAGGE